MRMFALILGIGAVLLGGLWLAQGLGLARVEPIACVAECETLEGPSPLWAGIGAGVFAAGALAVWWGLKRRGPRG